MHLSKKIGLLLAAAILPAVKAQNSTMPKWSWTSSTQKMLGIALGNWLVLERWMDEQWFVSTCGDSNAQDQWSFIEAMGASAATTALNAHYSSYITDQDIATIAQSGFNTIRIPVGYWSFLQTQIPGTPYVVGNDIQELNRIMAAAQANNLYVLLDLHGMPGSQNGEQESGHVGNNGFYASDMQQYGDQTIAAVIAFIQASPYKGIISGLAACNEPIFYTQDQYETLVQFYERSYTALSAAGIPMLFHPGHPKSDPLALWQGFINGKDPNLLILEIHPYVGRMSGNTNQNNLVQQVCNNAQSYQGYGVPVAVTEWSLDTPILNNQNWETTFYSAQAKAWSYSAGSVFWSYKAATYSQYNDTAPNYLSSFVDLVAKGSIPRPSSGQSTQQYLAGLANPCGSSPTETWASPVPSQQPSVTNALRKRSLSKWT